MFGDIKKALGLSKIHFPVKEKKILDTVLSRKVHFKYRNSVENFDDLLEFCQIKKAACNENYLGENMVLDRLIIMDDVSGLAD